MIVGEALENRTVLAQFIRYLDSTYTEVVLVLDLVLDIADRQGSNELYYFLAMRQLTSQDVDEVQFLPRGISLAKLFVDLEPAYATHILPWEPFSSSYHSAAACFPDTVISRLKQALDSNSVTQLLFRSILLLLVCCVCLLANFMRPV